MEIPKPNRSWLPDAQLEMATGFQNPYGDLIRDIESTIETGELDVAQRLLTQLLQRYPIPQIDIVKKEVWGTEQDELVRRTHGPVDFAEAVANVERTGRILNEEERRQLQLLASHYTGWSPTLREHRDDPWMRYLRCVYSLPDLEPVFDSLTWPDEIAEYPCANPPPLTPWLFLLATCNKFYVYVYEYEGTGMFEAGDTLTEVIEGMRQERYFDGDNFWPVVEPVLDQPARDYFPVYDALAINGDPSNPKFGLVTDIEDPALLEWLLAAENLLSGDNELHGQLMIRK